MSNLDIRGFEDWIDQICNYDCYEEIPCTDDNYYVGQFFSTHIRYPFIQSPKVLEIEKFDPNDEMQTLFRIAEYDPLSENQRIRPIRQLNLRSTDRLYISRGKVRTVILLKIVEHLWMEDETAKLALCLPLSSFKLRTDARVIIKTQLFDFPQYFYIKPSDMGPREESAARLDLIQYVCLDHIKSVQNDRSGLNFKLSSFTLKLLLNHLSKYLLNKPLDETLEEEIKAFHDILMSEEKIISLLA